MQKRDQPSLFRPAPLPVASLSEEERLACLRLIRSENIGPITFRILINQFGGAQQAIAALPDLARRGGARRPIRLCPRDEAEAELERAATAGAKPLFTIEPDYPALLAHIDAPPPMIYVKGRRELLNLPAVAIVGSRQCSAAGTQMSRLFATRLGECGFVVVSGLARGIDRAAHEAALPSGTIAVLAGGIDWVYPPEHADLQSRIGSEGCLVSDQPPGFWPRDKDFPRRNRIIAALAFGVVIIEAAARSGTLVTARYSNEMGREVFALPGHPLDPRAEGTNRLIKQGATLVTSADEVIDVLRPIIGLDSGTDAFQAPGRPPEQPSTSKNLSRPNQTSDWEKQTSSVLAALGPAPVSIDAIARVTGLGAQSVQIALLELDLAGRVERQGFNLVALKSA